MANLVNIATSPDKTVPSYLKTFVSDENGPSTERPPAIAQALIALIEVAERLAYRMNEVQREVVQLSERLRPVSHWVPVVESVLSSDESTFPVDTPLAVDLRSVCELLTKVNVTGVEVSNQIAALNRNVAL